MKMTFCFLNVIFLSVSLCLSQELLIVRVNKSTQRSIDEALQANHSLKLSHDEIMKADSSVRPAQRDFAPRRTKGATDEQKESETLVSKEMLEDGATCARIYIVKHGYCTFAGFGWQIPVGIYTSLISSVVADYKQQYEMVQPEQKVKTDQVTGQDRPCLVWSLSDRTIILDWTSLREDLPVGGYGLIQLVAAEKGFAGLNHMDRFLNAATDDNLFELKENGMK